jgi:hypothetical protein
VLKPVLELFVALGHALSSEQKLGAVLELVIIINLGGGFPEDTLIRKLYHWTSQPPLASAVQSPCAASTLALRPARSTPAQSAQNDFLWHTHPPCFLGLAFWVRV